MPLSTGIFEYRLYGRFEYKTYHTLLHYCHSRKQSIVASTVFSKAISGSILLFGEIRLFISIGISYRVSFVRKGFETQHEKNAKYIYPIEYRMVS